MQTICFTIHEWFDQKKVLDFFAFYHLSRKSIHQLNETKKIYVNGVLAHSYKTLNTNDVLCIDFSEHLPSFPTPVEKHLEIAYEDDDILIINKPIQMLIYSDGNTEESITNYVAWEMKNKGYTFPVLPLHRLDFDTSGLVIYGKHPLAMSYLSHLFETQEMEKMYTCLVKGKLEKPSAIIDKPIGQDRHSKMMIISPTGKHAETKFQLDSEKDGYSKLNVWIKGGRKHQIRVHLKSVGHPIVGDTLYGGEKNSRLMLHFTRIKFIHPRTLKPFEYGIPSPF